MEHHRRLPKDKVEVEDREAAGLWKAIAMSKKIGEGAEKITLDTILSIHKTMLGSALPEAAGRFRKDGEDVNKLKCIEPPPGRLVKDRIYVFWKDFDNRLAVIPRHPKNQTKHQLKKWRENVIDVAAWAQHGFASIHPFCDGNGRMARLLTNIILRRYGLPPTSVHYEGDNKSQYLKALCQIDEHRDYDALKILIIKGIMNSYKKEAKVRMRKYSE
ncbi:hypothetical protein A2662_01980 [Candidatus Giovannonibacteria bacterium RIFCSPHIGHO2_01_FULL_45_33]|nr:MAG: hypothetical protein A2662_01980 [Candidatus Giovannonibacteria bacterium RIFCSPHIGHO2_01_FULL_45_33]